LFQKRFASDDTKPTETSAETAESVAVEAENFAQTRTEAPFEEDLTPAQEAAQAPPTDASATAGAEALEAAAEGVKSTGTLPKRIESLGLPPPAPNNVVYVGNLYYEVGEDQLEKVFSRFGTVKTVRIMRDNKGLSRG
jgi:nucleolin